jgi:squalene/oxidosqualene cyclase-like protein
MFLLPMYVAMCHATRREIPEQQRVEMIRYVRNVQRADGAVGLHAEGDPSMFTTALTYVMIRLLGVGSDDPLATRMARWITDRGGPVGAASWGKFTLALLGLYAWEGLHPIQPELWLLPAATPFHPGRLWCHCRQVYLPMSYLYAKRATCQSTPELDAIRRELYPLPYEQIDFVSHRDTIAREDAYRADSRVLAVANRALHALERAHSKALRARATRTVYEHICYEDDVTNDIKIGPVNAVLNTWCHVIEGHDDRAERGFAQLSKWYLWQGHDGLKMQGYNSCELWDTAFATQAILAAQPLVPEYNSKQVLNRAYGFVRDNQIVDELPQKERYFRHGSKGGWPFSNRPHGWPITDCTAEGLKVALAMEPSVPAVERIDSSLLRQSVRLLLSWQNNDGGWATYERQRGGAWLEKLNPSQVFGDIMVDYSYPECTSAAVQALVRARARFAGEFDGPIDQAVRRAVSYLRSVQRDDGSFEGSWAVCFTYGTWFAVTGLLAGGASVRDPAVVRACEFLLSKQRSDGAWGEHHRSSAERRWIDHPDGHAANTSWALMTLLRANSPAKAAIDRAARWLIAHQSSDGSWPRESIVGVFNRTCLINYENYRRYFPLWALAEYAATLRPGR